MYDRNPICPGDRLLNFVWDNSFGFLHPFRDGPETVTQGRGAENGVSVGETPLQAASVACVPNATLSIGPRRTLKNPHNQ